jgi:hypothetical protein
MPVMKAWGVLHSVERYMAHHAPRKDRIGPSDKIPKHRGIGAMPRMRWAPHQPPRDHRCHHKHSPGLGLGNDSDSDSPLQGHSFKIWAENTSALSWMKNLIRFLMAILITYATPCILQGEHIPGEQNVGADRLSCPTLAPTWASVMAECPTAKLCWCCQVPPALLSALASAIASGSFEANVVK